MRSPADDRGRPLAKERPHNVVSTDNHQSTDLRPRCARCGHVVFTATSIRVGIGLACRRALARAAQEVAA